MKQPRTPSTGSGAPSKRQAAQPTPLNSAPLNSAPVYSDRLYSAALSWAGNRQSVLVLFIILIIFAAVTITFYLTLYNQTRLSQALIPPAMIAFSLVALIPVVFLLRSGTGAEQRTGVEQRTFLAGFLLLFGEILAYGGNELAWSGLTVYHIIGGSLLLLFSANVILPRRWDARIIPVVVYLVFLLIVNVLPLSLVRHPQALVPALLPYAIGTNVLLVAALILQGFLNLQSGSMRGRLLVIFVAIVLLPVVILGTVSSILTAQTAQQKLQDQLESISVLKQAQIHSWLDSMQSTLQIALPAGDQLELVEALLTSNDSAVSAVPGARASLNNSFQQIVIKADLFDEISLLDPSGAVLLTTDQGMGVGSAPSVELYPSRHSEVYFQQALHAPYSTPLYRSLEHGLTLVVAAPVRDAQGQTIAVLTARAKLRNLYLIMGERVGLGETSETYLASPEDGLLLTPSIHTGFTAGESILQSQAMDHIRLISGDQLPLEKFSGLYIGYRGEPVAGSYSLIPELNAILFTEEEQAEAFQSTAGILRIMVLGVLVAAILAALISLVATARILGPVSRLAQAAEKIASGSMDAEVAELQDFTSPQVETLAPPYSAQASLPRDEISRLSVAFGTMTHQLRALVSGLEQRVEERTRALERRSVQLQIAADVAREATSVRDLDELLNRAVYLICERFGYYHAGIFLVDEPRQFAVLMASTGEGGRLMLQRGHKLKIGETGMVGYVANTGLPRIASDVSLDPTHYVNPLLPDTRSEAVLPLKVSSRVIGALDVQSIETQAFDEDTINVLAIVADQLSIAIESARALKETAQALQELESVYGGYTRQSWRSVSQHLAPDGEKRSGQKSAQVIGYRFRGLDISPVISLDQLRDVETQTLSTAQAYSAPLYQSLAEQAMQKNQTIMREIHPQTPASSTAPAQNNLSRMAVPLRLRDQVIGAIEVQFKEGIPSADLVNTYEEISRRLTLFLENARLLQEARGIAAREQQVNVITTRLRSAVDLDGVLRNTVQEVGRAFGVSRTFIHLGASMPGNQDAPIGDDEVTQAPAPNTAPDQGIDNHAQ